MRDYTLAQIAYEAYCDQREWKAFNGDALPQWDKVPEYIKDAWWEAAEAVGNKVTDNYRIQGRFK